MNVPPRRNLTRSRASSIVDLPLNLERTYRRAKSFRTGSGFFLPRMVVRAMSQKLKQFLQRWIISTVAVLVATMILRGRIDYGGPLDLLIATLVLGLLNSFVRLVLLLLSLPFIIFTFGLFTLVVNAVLLLLVSSI